MENPFGKNALRKSTKKVEDIEKSAIAFLEREERELKQLDKKLHDKIQALIKKCHDIAKFIKKQDIKKITFADIDTRLKNFSSDIRKLIDTFPKYKFLHQVINRLVDRIHEYERTLQDGMHNKIFSNTEELARSFTISLGNAIEHTLIHDIEHGIHDHTQKHAKDIKKVRKSLQNLREKHAA
ncbi:MAG: hypothetical protein ACMXYE_02800 [Candidatus Woesearchaeota archaeon]